MARDAEARGEKAEDATAERSRRVLRALEDDHASVRLRAALEIGSRPHPDHVDALVERCAVEPEFPVREMLTWALTRLPADATVPRLVDEVRSERTQARRQALHTLSKVGDREAWSVITRELLADPDDEVARNAWRAAVVLVPEGEERELAAALATQLGRGGRETRLSLSRVLIALGEVIVPVLDGMAGHPDPGVREHALATERLLRHPDEVFEFTLHEARRAVALSDLGRAGE
ncbi:hypothetical protein BU197_05155 [Streptomyces sp. CBMA291]|nr:hypothetical protein [Streptomyces sp. CBMA291]MBD0713950.1 hypothetical protein [Streptomyces sp. CBMA370]